MKPMSPPPSPLRIVNVDAWVATVELDTPWQIGTGPLTEMSATIARVELDNGVVGWGECLAREAPGATQAIVRELLAKTIVGMDAWSVEAIWEKMYRTMKIRGHSRGFFMEAVAGVDIAIWDALGRSLGQPVWRLLHGERTELPCYASSIMISDDPRITAAEAERLAAEGWNAIKIKVGRGAAADLQTVAAARAAIGPEVQIMLDANGVYRADEAITLRRGMVEHDVRWLEEPVPVYDLSGYQKVAAAAPGVPLAGGEAEYAAAGFLPYIENRYWDVVQPNVSRAGGITSVRRIALLADAHNISYAPHTGASGALCMAASLHLAASMPNFMIYEHMYVDQPLQHLVEGLPTPVDSLIAVPQGPGLGVDVDEEALRKQCRI